MVTFSPCLGSLEFHYAPDPKQRDKQLRSDMHICFMLCHQIYEESAEDPHDSCLPKCYYKLFNDDYFWS